jgi:TolB-like protein/AraC-like DNA-binding protein/Tfp pilus assembly protein PilF
MSAPKSIAVLPFVNMSADKDNEFFSDGITEEIINALAHIPKLKVTSRTSSFFFKNKNIPIQEIGAQLNVSLLLEGSVRLAGNTMRITAQLIHAQDDFHFWSETWDRSTDNIFQVQDEVSISIAEKAREFLGHFEISDHLTDDHTNNYTSYEWYLKGLYYLRTWTPTAAQKSADCFRKALELDPNHAQAMLGLADTLGFLATTGVIDMIEGWQQTGELIHRALEINDTLPEAHYQLSNLIFFTQGDYGASLDAALKSFDINPNYIEANRQLCFLYTISGEFKEAKRYAERIMTLDPLAQESQFFDAYYDYMTGDYEGALNKFNRSLKENNLNTPAQSIKAYCLIKLGRYEDALQHYDEVPKEALVDEDKMGIEVLASIGLGQEQAYNLLTAMEQRAQTPEGFRADSFLPLAYTVLGRIDDAFKWIEKAAEKGSPFLNIHMNDPLCEALRSDPRYAPLHTKVYQKNTTVRKERKSKPLLSDSETKNYLLALDTLMRDQQPYLDPDLSLRSLAQDLGMSGNQLSFLLNEHIGKNFNAYINDFRIAAFQEKTLDPKFSNLTIVGLAYECGFNSKTVFNTYFKKATGHTPKQWISMHTER